MKFTNRGNNQQFFDLFSKLALKGKQACDLFANLLREPDQKKRKSIYEEINEVEHEGDSLNHELIGILNRSFITPFDRNDISTIGSLLDDCIDLVDEASDFIVLYQVHFPPEVQPLIWSIGEVLKECASQTAEAMPRISTPSKLRDYWIAINSLENEGDSAYRKALKLLFDSKIDPIEVIKLKDVIQVMEKCVDAFEDLANCIESISIKEA